MKNDRLTVQAHALYMYQGFQVIEAYSEDKNECYYLLFYKTQFLTARKTLRIKRISMLKQVLTKGIQILAPNPIINSLLPDISIKSLASIDSIWNKINKIYSKTESLHILTLFDTYLKKDQIREKFKNSYYEYRREGKLFHAYQLLMTMLQAYPSNKWAKSMISNVQFMKYSKQYQSKLDKLISIDPVYVENILYQQLDSIPSISLLDHKLNQDHRSIERVTLYYHLITKSEFEIDFSKVLTALSKTYPGQECATYLYSAYHLSQSNKNKNQIFSYLLTLTIQNEQYENAFNLLTTYKSPLNVDEIDLVITMVEKKLASSTQIDFLSFKADLLRNATTVQSQKIITLLLPCLFENHPIEFVYNWLEPFHYQRTSLPIIEKLKTMNKIKEDPDQQHYMGELYYQLHLLPQAVDCFNWDLELNPSHTRPLKWLSKLYRELGMLEESKSYQYLFQQIQKGS